MTNPAVLLSLKIAESVGWGLGPAIAAFNLFSFSLTRGGNYYYKNGTTWGIAFGVFLICLAIIARKWQR